MVKKKPVKKPPAEQVRTLKIRLPNLKKAQALLNKLEAIKSFCWKVRQFKSAQDNPKSWNKHYTCPTGGEKHADVLSDLILQQSIIIKGIKAKQAVMMDQGNSEWNHDGNEEDDNGWQPNGN